MSDETEKLAPPANLTAEQRETFEALKPKQQRAVLTAIETIEAAEHEREDALALAAAMQRRRSEIGQQVQEWAQELHQRVPEMRRALLEGDGELDDLVDLLNQRRVLRDLEAELPELDKAVDTQRARSQQPQTRILSAQRTLGINGLA